MREILASITSNYVKIVICNGLLYSHNEISSTYPINSRTAHLIIKNDFACIATIHSTLFVHYLPLGRNVGVLLEM